MDPTLTPHGKAFATMVVGKPTLLQNAAKRWSLRMGAEGGLPVISLYANPERAAPYLSRHWCVNRYPEALRKFNHLDLNTAPWGTRVRDPQAMDLISVEDVTNKLDELMAAKKRGEALLSQK